MSVVKELIREIYVWIISIAASIVLIGGAIFLFVFIKFAEAFGN
jgi:hypothetical protein